MSVGNDVINLVGVPFLNGGRNPQVGLDCWGLVMEAYFRLTGNRLPDFRIDAMDADRIAGEILNQETSPAWELFDKPGIGRVVVIKNHPRFKNHTGLCISDTRFIHTMGKMNAVIDRLNSPAWRNRIYGYYRWMKEK